MGRKCEVIFCANNEARRNGASFFHFPSNPEICAKWVQFCRSEELRQIFIDQGESGVVNRKICSDHFEEDDFRIRGRRDRGLRNGAVPQFQRYSWIVLPEIPTSPGSSTMFVEEEWLDAEVVCRADEPGSNDGTGRKKDGSDEQFGELSAKNVDVGLADDNRCTVIVKMVVEDVCGENLDQQLPTDADSEPCEGTGNKVAAEIEDCRYMVACQQSVKDLDSGSYDVAGITLIVEDGHDKYSSQRPPQDADSIESKEIENIYFGEKSGKNLDGGLDDSGKKSPKDKYFDGGSHDVAESTLVVKMFMEDGRDGDSGQKSGKNLECGLDDSGKKSPKDKYFDGGSHDVAGGTLVEKMLMEDGRDGDSGQKSGKNLDGGLDDSGKKSPKDWNLDDGSDDDTESMMVAKMEEEWLDAEIVNPADKQASNDGTGSFVLGGGDEETSQQLVKNVDDKLSDNTRSIIVVEMENGCYEDSSDLPAKDVDGGLDFDNLSIVNIKEGLNENLSCPLSQKTIIKSSSGAIGESRPKIVTIDPNRWSEMITVASASAHSTRVQMLQEKISTLQCKLKKEKQKNRRNTEIIQRKNEKSKKISKTLKMLKKERQKDGQLIKNLKNNKILLESLQNENIKPRSRKFSAATRKFALSMFLCGPRVYRMVKSAKVLTLPSTRTLKRWTHAVKMRPGLNQTILETVKDKVEHFQPKERIVTVCIDGMKIKSTLSYSAKLDHFAGFPDDGKKRKFEKNNVSKLATEAVTVLVQGIDRKFKQAVGYFLAYNSFTSKEQEQIVSDSVRSLRQIGLEPKVLAMDQFSVNIKMAKEMGSSIENPVIHIDQQPLYIFWDSPHLLKSARNMLKKQNAVYGSGIACFDDVERMFELDSHAEPRLAPRVTEKHVRLPPFSSMNVAMAAQVLSKSSATATEFYVDIGELPESALQTAEFLRFHDSLFDSFNSKHVSCPGKPLKGAICTDSPHWNFLQEAKDTLQSTFYTKKDCRDLAEAKSQSMELTVVQRKPHYIRGFISNINALKMLWHELRDDYGFDYLCTNRLQTDVLENFFSEIRRRGGSNDRPDADKFGSAFKYAIIENSFKITNGNCIFNATPTLLAEDDLNFITSEDDPIVCYDYKFSPLDINTPMEITLKEINGLMYIAGASIRKLPHKKCIKNLKNDNEKLDSNEAYKFCLLKTKNTGWKHILPNSKLYDLSMLCFTAYKQKFKKFLYQNRNGVKARLKQYIDYDLFDKGLCRNCFNLTVDKIYNTLFQAFLKHIKTLDRYKVNKRNGKAARMCLPVKC